jgi:hypothetical protein
VSEGSVVGGQLERLLVALERDLPLGTWEAWPGGWPGQIEAAVIDSVFSIQARYGKPGDCQTATGVRRVIACWRASRDAEVLDDLEALQGFAGWAVGQSRMAQKASGRPKAEIVSDVGQRLRSVGCRHAADFCGTSEQQRSAWASTSGLGPVTWSYLSMLLGHPDVKADSMLTRYVGRAIEADGMSSEAVRQLVTQAAGELAQRQRDGGSHVTATSLDHAIWNFERSSGSNTSPRRGRHRHG